MPPKKESILRFSQVVETKRNVDSYIAFYASLRGRMVEKSGLVSTLPDSIKNYVVAKKKISTIHYLKIPAEI